MATLGYIKDGVKGKVDLMPNSYPAEKVTYDNTTSGLTADDVQDAIDELAASSGGGHEILNPSGTAMNQEDKLQFTGIATVTDDSTNSKTVVNVGHSVLNSSATALTDRTNMQFTDSFVSDDDVNGRTVVENIKEHTTKADYDNATEDGFHVIDDGNDVPIGEIEEDVVSVTADGVKTYATLLDELYALIDSTKLTNNSYIDIFDGYFRLNDMSGGSYYFERAFSGAKLFNDTLQVSSSGSLIRSWETTTNGNTYSDSTSTQKPSNGTVITLYYGTSSTVINLKTSADYCQYDSNKTVKQAIQSTFKQYTFDDVTLSTARSYNDFSITLTADEISRLLFCNATVVESGVDIYQCYWEVTNNGVRVIGKAQSAGTYTIKVTLVFSA